MVMLSYLKLILYKIFLSHEYQLRYIKAMDINLLI